MKKYSISPLLYRSDLSEICLGRKARGEHRNPRASQHELLEVRHSYKEGIHHCGQSSLKALGLLDVHRVRSQRFFLSVVSLF